MNKDAAIVAKQLTHRYGKLLALNAVDVIIPSQTTVALVGPDGVGKSTLLSLFAGAKILQHGKIEVLGQNIQQRQARQEIAKRTAFMPQGLGKNLYMSLSIMENADFSARLYGQNSKTSSNVIQRLLEATGLAPFQDRLAGKLSGGMKQKLSLCCALVNQPDILILDEPTTGVDPLSRQQFWQLIADLRQENSHMTVLVSTAYMEEAELFEHLIAMDAGEILINAPTKEALRISQSSSVEEAYIKLLPNEKRPKGKINIPPLLANSQPDFAIEAKNLSKSFGNFKAVDNVSFQIAKGEIFGFLGSNGCGKSTTMKMLTGLLEASSGSAKLLGKEINAADITTRMRVGYMSQAFSLYEELDVYQNLKLHANLFHIPVKKIATTIEENLKRFDLTDVAKIKPTQLSLGVKQRLQLAAACLHQPEVLILDEPTSGVDPAARDMFWQHLVTLSRQQQVTIFVSTHFMTEAMLCDRISLMNRGRVLAVGPPQQLVDDTQANNLEELFIDCLIADQTSNKKTNDSQPVQHATASDHTENEAAATSQEKAKTAHGFQYWLLSTFAFAHREMVELMRDKVRMSFAILGSIILLVGSAYCISFDVKKIKFTVLDYDKSAQSAQLIEQFAGSRYFQEMPVIYNISDINSGMQQRAFKVAIVIPANFGKDLLNFNKPDLTYYVDGAEPFTANMASAYISGISYQFQQQLLRGTKLQDRQQFFNNIVESRFLFNQSFQSIYLIVPGLIMLILIIIPSVLTALSVVREKEMGSIFNLYTSPAQVSSYLFGKLIPYVILSMLAFATLIFLSMVIFQLPIKGSITGYIIGTLLYVIATCSLGIFISCFLNSQIAALFVCAISALVPAFSFSGFIIPTSSFTGISYLISQYYPTGWYQMISLGAFTKGLDWEDFIPMYTSLSVISLVLFTSACFSLKKQEN